MKKYLMEFIGTLFLVLAVGLTGNPLAIGITLAVMVYMGGHISGAHYNPAVSLAVWLRGKLGKVDMLIYWIAQLLGGFVAALLIFAVDKAFVPAGTGVNFWQAIVIEILFTFALASVILTVTTTKAFKGNYVYGFAIGLTLAAGAYVGGPISGGVYNPAVALGPAFLASLLGHSYPVLLVVLYIVGPLLGGALAAIAFRYLNKE